jgi:hypothetical protein
MNPPALNFQNGYKYSKTKLSVNFNLFDLHDSKKDDNLRKCLRVYGVLNQYVDRPKEEMVEAYKQAIWLNKRLARINTKLKKEIGLEWKKKWVEIIPYKISQSAVKDWFCGRSSLPLIAIEKLKVLGCEDEVREIIQNVKYISSTTRDITKIPNVLISDVAYLSGLILGDGCLPNDYCIKDNNYGYRVSIFGGNKSFFEEEIVPIMTRLFETKNVRLYYDKTCWRIEKQNKAMFRFFTKIIELHSGKKAINARIPKIIFNSSKEIKVAFLVGLIDSDIGKHGGSLGCTFRSEKFVEDLVFLLSQIGVVSRKRGTYIIKEKYPQTDFYIPKREVKALKDILYQNYLPKSKARLETINSIAGFR